MDPVAQQFVSELDDAFTELPESVVSGLMMCGIDAVPALVERLDADVRSGMAAEELLARADARVLGAVGMSVEEQGVLRAAWRGLRDRRQRRG